MSDESKPNLAYSEHSNEDLVRAVLARLRHSGPSREKSIAVTHLHTALLWLSPEAAKLP